MQVEVSISDFKFAKRFSKITIFQQNKKNRKFFKIKFRNQIRKYDTLENPFYRCRILSSISLEKLLFVGPFV